MAVGYGAIIEGVLNGLGFDTTAITGARWEVPTGGSATLHLEQHHYDPAMSTRPDTRFHGDIHVDPTTGAARFASGDFHREHAVTERLIHDHGSLKRRLEFAQKFNQTANIDQLIKDMAENERKLIEAYGRVEQHAGKVQPHLDHEVAKLEKLYQLRDKTQHTYDNHENLTEKASWAHEHQAALEKIDGHIAAQRKRVDAVGKITENHLEQLRTNAGKHGVSLNAGAGMPVPAGAAAGAARIGATDVGNWQRAGILQKAKSNLGGAPVKNGAVALGSVVVGGMGVKGLAEDVGLISRPEGEEPAGMGKTLKDLIFTGMAAYGAYWSLLRHQGHAIR